MKRVFSTFALLALLCFTSAAQADVINIFLTGLNFSYDGTDIYDSASKNGGGAIVANADSLYTIDFEKDGEQVGSYTSADKIYADLLVKSVLNIPTVGGTVTSGGNGDTFGLDLLKVKADNSVSTLLGLNFNQVYVSYSPSRSISLSGIASSIDAANLPFDLNFDPNNAEINFVISGLISPAPTGTPYLTGFKASGTETISVVQDTVVPEPSSCILGFASILLGAGVVLRRRNG